MTHDGDPEHALESFNPPGDARSECVRMEGHLVSEARDRPILRVNGPRKLLDLCPQLGLDPTLLACGLIASGGVAHSA
jgi:hypothetical protein